jgi:hypothetical protein
VAVEQVFAPRWFAITLRSLPFYWVPSRDDPPTRSLAAGTRVPVLGRTDGGLQGALCAVVGEFVGYLGVRSSLPGWVECEGLQFDHATAAAIPILTPAPQTPRVSKTPALYTSTDVMRLLRLCTLTFYGTTHRKGDHMQILDGSEGLVPPGVQGRAEADVVAIDALLQSNPQRCGFRVSETVE